MHLLGSLVFWSPLGFGSWEALEVRLEGESKKIQIFIFLVFLSNPTPMPRLLGILAVASFLCSYSSCQAIPLSHLQISIALHFLPVAFSGHVVIMASCYC